MVPVAHRARVVALPVGKSEAGEPGAEYKLEKWARVAALQQSEQPPVCLIATGRPMYRI